MNPSYLHLKICEGCGRLWARGHAIQSIYCCRCTVHFADFPAPLSRRPKGRPRKALREAAARCNSGGVQ